MYKNITLSRYPIPDLRACLEAYTTMARLTNPAASPIGLCVNTSSLTEEQALEYLRETEKTLGLPCCDPVRTGVSRIVDLLQS